MRAPEYQGSFLGRISIRRNQVISMETNHEQELEVLEQFQKHVSDRFSDLMAPPPSDASSAAGDHHHGITAGESLLSIAWLRKLLDSFVCCEAEFKAILVMGRDPSHISKPPLDRLIPEMLDREVKALDVCNAVTHGVESIRNLQKLAEIAVAALDSRPVGEGQVRRAKKALAALAAAVALDEKESSAGGKSTERSWSLGRRGGAAGIQGSGGFAAAAASMSREGSLRSSSWTVSKNWSAAKQIHAMAANLVAPRSGENSSLALTAYMMSTVLVFVMWALVAAIPCQERAGLPTSIPVPRNLGWAQPMATLQEKIAEEWKKKEKKSAAGLMEEMQQMEKLCQSLIDHADSFQPPVSAAAAAAAAAGTEEEEKRAVEMASQVAELAEVCRKMEDGLAPLQMQIREVFRRMVRSRTEVLEVLDQASKSSASSVI